MAQPEIHADDILVRAQDTPNPNAIKFIINFSLKDVGNATFTSAVQSEGKPLIMGMFDIPGVEQVYVFQNTLTITHTEELPTATVKENVISVLKTRLGLHRPDFLSPEEAAKKVKPDRSTLPADVQQIEEILDRTIRPGLQSDGGDIEVIDFKDNHLNIAYQGACGGCPSSMMGTLEAIQSILRNEMGNEAITVTPV